MKNKIKIVDYQIIKNTITLYDDKNNQIYLFLPKFIKIRRNYCFSEKIKQKLDDF